MTPRAPLRVAEWSRTPAPFPAATRAALLTAARVWQAAHRLAQPPLDFGGPDGTTLLTRQHVGVVEAGGAAVEIYPKLDALPGGAITADAASGTMRHLLALLAISRHEGLIEADQAPLAEMPSRFLDAFALLLGRRLARELAAGPRHEYLAVEGLEPVVRGRIDFAAQLTRHWDRADRIACRWEEFSADVPLNRVLKTAVRELARRTGHPEAARRLAECHARLDAASDVAIPEALALAPRVRWDRGNARFRRSFALAVRLLAGCGHALRHGGAETFVFLLDMNALFEDYAGALLVRKFGVRIARNEALGALFRPPARGIAQEPDYAWTAPDGTRWIGDAKYKRLLANELPEETGDAAATGPAISAHDARQLFTYARLATHHEPLAVPRLALLFPCAGAQNGWVEERQFFDRTRLALVPVRLDTPGAPLPDFS